MFIIPVKYGFNINNHMVVTDKESRSAILCPRNKLEIYQPGTIIVALIEKSNRLEFVTDLQCFENGKTMIDDKMIKWKLGNYKVTEYVPIYEKFSDVDI